MKLLFATGNEHKLREVSQLAAKLNLVIIGLRDLAFQGDVEETGSTLEENALIKARHAFEHFKMDCFGEDTGLEIEALDGAPGVHTARYAGERKDTNNNMDKVLHLLQTKANRKARFRAVIALVLDGKEHLFEGIVNGEIIHSKKGAGGFGYDPIFQPEGYNQSFGELGDEIKEKLSHRSRAFLKMLVFLKENTIYKSQGSPTDKI